MRIKLNEHYFYGNDDDIMEDEYDTDYCDNGYHFDLEEFTDAYNEAYDYLYDNDTPEESRYARAFDEMVKTDPQFKSLVGEFVDYRKDFISSDREAAAFMSAFTQLNR